MFTVTIAPLLLLLGSPAVLANHGISELWTKTSSIRSANTNDNVTMEVCNMKGLCCTAVLDDPAKDDREKGNVDKYTTASMLGDCFGQNFYGDLTATLTKDKSDGWFVEWAQIKFDDTRSYTCEFNNWLDDSADYSTSMTVNCGEDAGITEIWTKTGSMRYADTNDHVDMKICDNSGNCCESDLDIKSYDDRKKGKVDKYTDPEILANCIETRMKGQLFATLSKDRSNGWYVEWAKIQLIRGRSFTCMFNLWLDDSSGYENSKTVPCTEDVGVTEISTKTGSMRHAGTNDAVSIKICDGKQICCTTFLDTSGHDDHEKGHVDFFADPADLGSCISTRMNMKGGLTATLEKDGSDGWYAEWAQITLARGYAFTCTFGIWLDNDNGHTRSESAQCTQDHGIQEIWTQTGTRRSADTNDSIKIKVCDSASNCCETPLDDPAKDDRKRSALDKYSDPDMLGSCFNTDLTGDVSVTLSKDGSNGWYPEWAQIFTDNGVTYLCTFGTWMDDSGSYSNTMTVDCDEA